MKTVFPRATTIAIATAVALPASAGLSAQEMEMPVNEQINVRGTPPADLEGMADGPDVEGLISARTPEGMQITTADGTEMVVLLSESTEIRGRGGFLGLGRSKRAQDALLNGLPVTVKTVEWGGGLIASKVRFNDRNLQTASMIRTGTNQRFGENEASIQQNAAATEALRGRVGDIDKYNIKGTTNVNFATGKWQLSAQDEQQLCNTANQANATENALLLVVGYTDSVGDQDYNQTLSERRASRVVNHLQQKCGWAPYRMLTPTGMAEAAPLADNESATGRAQNRRVSVNIMVSKALDGL